MNRRTKAYLYLLAVAALWGVASPIIKFTLGGIDPLPFLAYRFAIAAVFSVIFFIHKLSKGKKFHHFKANLPMVIIYGILAVPFALGVLFLGIDKSTVLDLTLVGALGPLAVTAGGSLFFHDHITHREKIGIGVVLVGVLFNSFYPVLMSEEVRLTGNILLLLYLLADSSSTLISKRLVQKKVKSSNLTNAAFIIGALVLIPLAINSYGLTGFIKIITDLPLKYHLGVWYMALASGSLAYYFYVQGQKSIEVSEAVIFNYLQPVFTVPLAIFWLGESLSSHFVFGAMLIAIGIYIAERKNSNYAKKA